MATTRSPRTLDEQIRLANLRRQRLRERLAWGVGAAVLALAIFLLLHLAGLM